MASVNKDSRDGRNGWRFGSTRTSEGVSYIFGEARRMRVLSGDDVKSWLASLVRGFRSVRIDKLAS